MIPTLNTKLMKNVTSKSNYFFFFFKRVWIGIEIIMHIFYTGIRDVRVNRFQSNQNYFEINWFLWTVKLNSENWSVSIFL